MAGAALVVLPFFFSAGFEEQFRWPKVKLLACMAAIYLAIQVGRRINVALGWAAGFAFVSAFWIGPVLDIEGIVGLAAGLGSCFWVAHPSERNVKGALKLLKWAGVVCAVYAICQHSDFDLVGILTGHPLIVFNKPDAHLHPSVLFGQQTLYGPFAVAAFAAAMFECRWSSYGIAALLALPIYYIDSSFTYLALAVVVFAWAFYKIGKKAFLLAALLPLLWFGGWHYWPDKMEDLKNDNGRYRVWAQTWRLTKLHPVRGLGFGSFKTIYPAFQNQKTRERVGIDDSKMSAESQEFMKEANQIRIDNGTFLSSHNEFLQLYFECGLIGVFLAGLMFLSYVIHATYMAPTATAMALHAIFFSFMANSIGNFALHLVPQVLLPLWAYVAVTTFRESGILDP